MIKQCAASNIESRSECDPFDKTGFLPIITANMYSVVDKHNVSVFLNNNIKVCMPRGEYMDESYQYCKDENYFDSYSLDDFINNFVNTNDGFLNDKAGDLVKTSVCIDTAAGHLKKLHEAIRKAKEIHGDKLVIMAGNVASVEAFVELAKTGVDYIRVGIGGGGGCNTTSNTGVGQEDLESLIKDCSNVKKNPYKYGIVPKNEPDGNTTMNLMKVKIVADGISTYIKQCESKYGFNDNGYAAINKLLFAGADLVMVGKLFAQCVESAGEKKSRFISDEQIETVKNKPHLWYKLSDINRGDITDCKLMFTKYSGMSTKEEQIKYKNEFPIYVVAEGAEKTLIVDKNWLKVGNKYYYNNHEITITSGAFTNGSEYYYGVKEPITFKVGEQICLINKNIKPSEGSVNWIPVRWTLDEWLNGSDNQDSYPYLMGWVNSIKSAMSYTGKNKL